MWQRSSIVRAARSLAPAISPLVPALATGLALTAGAVTHAASAGRGEPLVYFDGSLGGVPHDAPCWEFFSFGPLSDPVNEDGAVVLGPTTDNGAHYWTQTLVPFSFDDGASITATLKVTWSSYYGQFPLKRAGYYITLTDKLGRVALLGVTSDLIVLATADQNWSNQTYEHDATDGYHVYTLAFNGNECQAFIDGKLVLTDAVGGGSGVPNTATFGDLSVLTSSHTHTALVVVEGIPDCASGDLDCNGVVDGADLGVLLSAWGTNACAADLNFDGVVNGADLGVLLGNWG